MKSLGLTLVLNLYNRDSNPRPQRHSGFSYLLLPRAVTGHYKEDSLSIVTSIGLV